MEEIRWKDTPAAIAREQKIRRDKVEAEKKLMERQRKRWAMERDKSERMTRKRIVDD